MRCDSSFIRVGTAGNRKAIWLSLFFLLSLAILQNGCAGLVANSSGGPSPQTLTVTNASTSGVTPTSAAVTWQTNLPATSQIEYGTSTAYGSTTALDASLVTSHQQAMSSLRSSTLYHFRVHSRDANNNEAVSADMTVTTTTTPDTTAPAVSITSPASGSTVSGTISVSASASDNVAVAGVQFKLDGSNLGAEDTSSPYSVSLNTTTVSNGNHTLTAVARDTSNNTTTSAGVTINVSNATPDTTPPSVSITSPSSGSTVSGTITVTANASDNVGVVGVQFKVDGSNLGAEDTSSPYSVSLNTSTQSNGNHSLTAVARDAAGNQATSSAVTINVNNTPVPDTTPPSVPANLTATAVSSSQVNLAWSASTDNVGVTGYKIFRNSSQVATTGSLSYLDSGLTASTSYTYQVAAYDAAGNTSAQSASASATTFSSSSGGGIPSTLGWFQIPNSVYNSVPIACSPGCDAALQGVEGSSAIVNDWSGGWADTKRDWLLVMGGGHKGYYGNQIYRLNLNTLAMDILKQPFPGPIPLCTESYPDGSPSAKHTYNGPQYAKNQDLYFQWGGGLPDCGNFGFSNWAFNPTTLAWTNLNPANAPGNVSGSFPQTAYDPATGQIFSHQGNASKFLSYNFGTNSWTLLKTSGLTGSCELSYMAAAVDPVHNDYVCVGGGRIAKIHLASPYNATTLTGSGCSGLASANAPGWDWDSSQSKFVGWAGGDTVYVYDPVTDSCTSQTFAGGPGTQANAGTYGRWRYFPDLNVFALVNRSGQNAYTLRLTPASGTAPAPTPVISAVSASGLTTNSAVITWTTDIGATSQVEYGTSTGYGTLTTVDSSLLTAHSVALSGLASGTLYHFRIRSHSSGGTDAISGDQTFATNSAPAVPPPTVSVTSPANGATVTGTVNVSAAASAASGATITSVRFQVDGADYGSAVTSAPYTIGWDSSTVGNGTHTLTARATDSANNIVTSTGVGVSVSNQAPAGNFASRCAAPGVILCDPMDTQAAMQPFIGLDCGGVQRANVDNTIFASGTGSLRFEIPQNVNCNNTSGQYIRAFPQKFAQNSDFYYMFRWRGDTNMTTVSFGGDGWKVGTVYGGSSGCAHISVLIQHIFNAPYPVSSKDCGSTGFETLTTGGIIHKQQGTPTEGGIDCIYQSPSPTSCIYFQSNVWMTFYMHVHVGNWQQANSVVEAWAQRDGTGPWIKWINMSSVNFNCDACDGSDGFDHITLLPYNTNKTATSNPNPQSFVWYDELIISTQPIVAPN